MCTQLEMFCCKTTSTSQRERLEQENSALAAKVVALEKVLSLYQDVMEQLFGSAIEIRATSRELREVTAQAGLRQLPSYQHRPLGAWQEGLFSPKRKAFLRKLDHISTLATRSLNRISLSGASAGIPSPTDYAYRYSRVLATPQESCCEACPDKSPRP